MQQDRKDLTEHEIEKQMKERHLPARFYLQNFMGDSYLEKELFSRLRHACEQQEIKDLIEKYLNESQSTREREVEESRKKYHAETVKLGSTIDQAILKLRILRFKNQLLFKELESLPAELKSKEMAEKLRSFQQEAVENKKTIERDIENAEARIVGKSQKKTHMKERLEAVDKEIEKQQEDLQQLKNHVNKQKSKNLQLESEMYSVAKLIHQESMNRQPRVVIKERQVKKQVQIEKGQPEQYFAGPDNRGSDNSFLIISYGSAILLLLLAIITKFT